MQFIFGPWCPGQPGHLPGDHQERVHEDDHQHLPLQPGPCRPWHPDPCHASRTLPYVAAVSMDFWRGAFKYIFIVYFDKSTLDKFYPKHQP